MKFYSVFWKFRDEIGKEIQDSPFLSIITDETSDVAAKYQMINVYRYTINGIPVEGYLDL